MIILFSVIFLLIICFILIIQHDKKMRATDTTQRPNKSQYNQRNAFRITLVDTDCEFEILELKKFGKGHIKDISVSGMKLVTTVNILESLEPAISLKFYLDDEAYHLNGKVLRQVKTPHSQYEYGILFEDLDTLTEQRLYKQLLDYSRRRVRV